jgi:hypothetical protein
MSILSISQSTSLCLLHILLPKVSPSFCRALYISLLICLLFHSEKFRNAKSNTGRLHKSLRSKQKGEENEIEEEGEEEEEGGEEEEGERERDEGKMTKNLNGNKMYE